MIRSIIIIVDYIM